MLRSSKQDTCWNGVTGATPRFPGRTLRTGAAARLLLLICIWLAGLCGVEASSHCRVEEHPDGSTSYVLSVLECTVYNWLVNGVVVANEEDFNQSLVHKLQPQNITLTSCHSNVTYRNSCTGYVTECSYECLKKPFFAIEHKDHTGTVVAVVVIGAILLLVVFIALWKRKELKGMFQCRKRTYHTPPHQIEDGL